MGTLASGSIDLKSLKVAGEGATSYITSIDSNNGIKVHAVNNVDLNYTQITSEGMEIFKTDGAESNPSAISVAKFGTTARIGKTSQTHAEIGSNSLVLKDSGGNTYFQVRDAVNESGEVVNSFTGNGSKKEFTLSHIATNTTYTVTVDGTVASPTKTTTKFTFSTAPSEDSSIVATFNTANNSAKGYDLGVRSTFGITGQYSVIEGYHTRASGNYAHAEGEDTWADGSHSHAEGYQCNANGNYSHAEGELAYANGYASHAEGEDTNADGRCSHAEGYNTNAVGYHSHSEGSQCEANGYASHAEGRVTYANGSYSHAQNEWTIAAKTAQTALGRYNIEDTASGSYGDYAVIVGNGTSRTPSNALTVDWNGNVQASGLIKDTLQTTAPTITRSTGASVSAIQYRRSGHVAQLRFTYTYSTSVAAGANLFTGTLESGYRPTIGVLGVSYYGSNAIIGAIGTDGAITLRNASSTALTASTGGAIAFTYIIE